MDSNGTRQGGKSADYNARDVIKPMLDLVLEDTEENTLRPLIEAETIRVIEALVLGAAIEVRRLVTSCPYRRPKARDPTRAAW